MSEPQSPTDEVLVDARGLACPQPVIELATAAGAASVGTRITVLADDPAARVDIPVWCRMRRHRLLDIADTDDAVSFLVEILAT